MTTSIKYLILVCTIINLTEVLLILILKNHLPPVIPLFYGLPVSTSEIARSTNLIILPLISESLSITNVGVAKITKDKFLEKIASGFTILVTILSLVAVIKIFTLVGTF